MRFFLDNCISQTHAEALRVLAKLQKYDIVHLRDRYPASTKDADWLRDLGSEGDWVVVSGDPRISRGAAEKAAWRESRLTAFFLGDEFASKR